jgi:hypothetical protein
MTATTLALLLRPLFNALLLVLIVWPIAWLLYRLFPEGRLKVVLFRLRTGKHATTHDKCVMTVSVIAAYIIGLAWLLYLCAGIGW